MKRLELFCTIEIELEFLFITSMIDFVDFHLNFDGFTNWRIFGDSSDLSRDV